MDHEIKDLPMFYVAGLSVRTINKNGQASRDIGSLWQTFTQNNMAEKLEDREGNELYCVYTDYESDHNDYYVAILGCKVSSIEYLPEGFTGKAIPASKYMVFTPVGKFPANIAATWQHIWQSGIERKYTADFDVYDVTGKAFEDIESKVYVAVD
ncbi:GyrI-like domain-containing protein [Mucilaginibacter aquariorum]|uniref:GyrI-like domain-containing protein n=1 Tax=Mucilaginibacter aquariorum TaxID=2967225 RepID=A0ABT1SYG5_9SPHI|nr:GyrI-like domain-containing protein [Mucilaginibacter aquariorum]MCQ6957393.1 GyrI-like domain-containing protein [Mucilaginibacter aquariorum]